MNLPNDPIILLSVVNTRLRDYYSSLDEFCAAEDIDRKTLEKKLLSVGYTYNALTNQFT